MIFINERSTGWSGPAVPLRAMCSHAAGLSHSAANDAASLAGSSLPVSPGHGLLCSTYRRAGLCHPPSVRLSIHPSIIHPFLIPCSVGQDLGLLSLLS